MKVQIEFDKLRAQFARAGGKLRRRIKRALVEMGMGAAGVSALASNQADSMPLGFMPTERIAERMFAKSGGMWSPAAVGGDGLMPYGFNEWDGKRDLPGNGVVMASNDANLTGSVLVEPLNDFVSRIVDKDGLLEEFDMLFPGVPVGRQFAYHKHDELQDFQSDDGNDQDVRMIGGDFANIKFTAERVQGETLNKGLCIRIDHDQGGKDQAVREMWIRNITNRLIRSDLARASALLVSSATAATFLGGSQNWGPGQTSPPPDPDNVFVQVLRESGDERGIDSNILLMPKAVWAMRYGGLGTQSNNAAISSTRNMTPEQLENVLQIDKIHISERRMQNSFTASATAPAQTKKQIIGGGSNFLTYFAMQGASQFDPTNIKHFFTNADGQRFKVHVEERSIYTIITVLHYSTTIITSKLGLRKFGVTFTS